MRICHYCWVSEIQIWEMVRHLGTEDRLPCRQDVGVQVIHCAFSQILPWKKNDVLSRSRLQNHGP